MDSGAGDLGGLDGSPRPARVAGTPTSSGPRVIKSTPLPSPRHPTGLPIWSISGGGPGREPRSTMIVPVLSTSIRESAKIGAKPPEATPQPRDVPTGCHRPSDVFRPERPLTSRVLKPGHSRSVISPLSSDPTLVCPHRRLDGPSWP